ncbi:cyclase family protein [Halorubrum salinum]|uniref:cyclase family protein n=1 Tax=Halorubrum salinum TaxID=767517 RepID=UPI002110E7E0|nr:cyclase family protein [Halorubrum salinum]
MFRDLSRPIETGMPTYPGDPEVTLSPDATHAEDGYATSELRAGSHAGTHVDAPRHTLADGEPVDAVDAGSFALDARLVDLSDALGEREPIAAETLPGSVRDECDLLVVHTGWADRWGTDSYRDHPHLTEASAERCRDLGVGVGLDTFGPDPTPPAPTASKSGDPSTGEPTGTPAGDEPTGTPAHDALLGAGLPIVENLCSLARLPDRFRLYAFPLRLRDGDGSPVRAVAEWEA